MFEWKKGAKKAKMSTSHRSHNEVDWSCFSLLKHGHCGIIDEYNQWLYTEYFTLYTSLKLLYFVCICWVKAISKHFIHFLIPHHCHIKELLIREIQLNELVDSFFFFFELVDSCVVEKSKWTLSHSGLVLNK